MTPDQIKTIPNIPLKQNGIFHDVKIPYVYQRRGGLMLLLKPRMVLGDDVGLGKTLETILAYTYLKAKIPGLKFLLFTENNALRQWVKELKWLAPSIKSKIVTADTHGDKLKRIRAMRENDSDVIITNYHTLHNYSKYLKEGMGKAWICVFDEPDMFKNTDTVTHRRGFNLCNDNTFEPPLRVWGLTATIIGNRLDEAFGILRVVAPGTFASHKDFEKDYCVMRKTSRGMKVAGYKNLDKFREVISHVFYGRLQDDPEVEQELPEVITKDVEVILSKEQSWKVTEATDRLIEMADGEVKQLKILPAMVMAQILTDEPRVKGFDIVGAKITALLEFLKGQLWDQRVVIFSKYRSVIDVVEKEIRKQNLYVGRITGKESPEEREANKLAFMSDGEDHVPILLITNAGKRALNLQNGGHLFFFDLPWAYDDYRQIIGRLKRTGSRHKVIGVYRLLGIIHPEVAVQIGNDLTIDHHTLKILMKKFELWKAVTGDTIEVESGNEDMVEIFEEVKNSHRKAI